MKQCRGFEAIYRAGRGNRRDEAAPSDTAVLGCCLDWMAARGRARLAAGISLKPDTLVCLMGSKKVGTKPFLEVLGRKEKEIVHKQRGASPGLPGLGLCF